VITGVWGGELIALPPLNRMRVIYFDISLQPIPPSASIHSHCLSGWPLEAFEFVALRSTLSNSWNCVVLSSLSLETDKLRLSAYLVETMRKDLKARRGTGSGNMYNSIQLCNGKYLLKTLWHIFLITNFPSGLNLLFQPFLSQHLGFLIYL
jgi:hypothetical protein